MTSPADGNAARVKHLRLVDPATDHPSARALIDEGRALDKLGRRKEARARYEKALESLDPPAPSVASMLLRWIARTYEVDADYATAAACAERAVAMAEEADDRNALGHALNVLAAVRWRQGDLDEADRLFHEALKRGTSTTDPRLQVDVMTNLGSLAKIRGDFREALRCYEEALAHGRLHSLLDNILGTLNNLGIANMALRRLDAAEDAFTEALTIANALGGLSIRIQLEVNCASLQIEKGDYAEAKRRCDRAMSLASQLGDSRANAEAEKVYGIIARETGDLPQAEVHLIRAREMASAVNDLEFEGDVNRELAELFDRLGRSRETLQALNRAHACFTQLRARHELADVGRRMARLEGDFLDVVRQWGESIESKDHHTLGHCERVADLAGALAAKAGLDEGSLFWFRIGALLHDVGKLIVPAEVLNKPIELTDAEWTLIRQHPAGGAHPLHRRRIRRADDAAQLQAGVLASRGDGDHASRVGTPVRSTAVHEVRGAGATRHDQHAADDGAEEPRAAHGWAAAARGIGGGRPHRRARTPCLRERHFGGAGGTPALRRHRITPRVRRRSLQVGERQLRPSHR